MKTRLICNALTACLPVAALLILAATVHQPLYARVALALGTCTIVAALAWSICLRWLPLEARRSERLLATFVVSCAIIVVTQQSCGFLGILSATTQYWACGIFLVLESCVLRLGPTPPEVKTDPWWSTRSGRVVLGLVAVSVCGFVAPLARFVLPYPTESWDAWSYHLYFPARWLETGRIDYLATPFGPEFLTYFPLNAELLWTWLAAPLSDDLLAKVGQAPFLLGGSLAVYALTRRLGVAASRAWPGALLVLAVPVWQRRTASTDNDLMLAVLFVSCLALLLLYRDTRHRGAALAAGLAAGLFLGTKVTAVVYGVLLLVPLLAYVRASRRCWKDLALFAIAAASTGSVWYVRNLIQTGNPVYPAEVQVAGVTLFVGPLSRGGMEEGGWTPGETGVLGLVDAWFSEFGWGAAVVAACLLLGAMVWWVRDRRQGSAGWVLFAGAAVALMAWFLIPYRSQIRYAYPGALVGLVSVGYVAGKLSAVRLPIVVATLACWVAGMRTAATVSTSGVIGAAQTAHAGDGCVLVGLLLLSVWLVFAVTTHGQAVRRVVLLAALLLGLSLTLTGYDLNKPARRETFAATRGYGSAGLDPYPWQQNQRAMWQWVNALPGNHTIAYSGHNNPYLLLGRGYRHRVRYVPVTQSPTWELYDFVSELRQRGEPLTPIADRTLADRRHPDRLAWLQNLSDQQVELLVMTTIHRGETRYWQGNMDEEGFPIERRWADEDPDRFVLSWHRPTARIYRIIP